MQHVRGIRRRKEAPYSKLGHCVNALLVGGLCELTSDVPITAEHSKMMTAGARDGLLTQDR